MRHEKRFELASDWPIYFEQYAPWLQAAPKLVRNAVRWSHDTWAVLDHSDLLISYNDLVENPRPWFERLDALLVSRLGDYLGEGSQPDMAAICAATRKSDRKMLLTDVERRVVDAICLRVWEAFL